MFTPIKNVPDRLQKKALKWAQLARLFGYEGPLLWNIHRGYRVEDKLVSNVNTTRMPSDVWANTETTPAMGFFIPRLIGLNYIYPDPGEVDHIRKFFRLPEHHLKCVELNVVAGLFEAYLSQYPKDYRALSVGWAYTKSYELGGFLSGSDPLTLGRNGSELVVDRDCRCGKYLVGMPLIEMEPFEY